MEATLTLTEGEYDAALRLAKRGLSEFNAPFTGDPRPLTLTVTATRPGEAEPAGALVGLCAHGWLYLHMFFLPEDMRGGGLGARMVRQMEEAARAHGCVGAWVDSYSFQAPGFYERQGYARFGEITGFPPGHSRVFLMKRLDAEHA